MIKAMKEFAFKNVFSTGVKLAAFILWRLFGFLFLRKNVVKVFKIIQRRLDRNN